MTHRAKAQGNEKVFQGLCAGRLGLQVEAGSFGPWCEGSSGSLQEATELFKAADEKCICDACVSGSPLCWLRGGQLGGRQGVSWGLLY